MKKLTLINHGDDQKKNVRDTGISPDDYKYQNMSDVELIEKILEGDEDAFKQLYERYYSFVRAVVLPIVRNESVVDDLISKTFLNALKGLDGCREKAKFSGWLSKIAKNACTDWIRREKRRNEVSFSDSEDSSFWEELLGCNSNNPQENFLDKEKGEKLKDAINQLKPKLRDVVVLRGIIGLSVEETAKELGISPGEVSKRLKKAREKLKEILGPNFNIEIIKKSLTGKN